MRVLVCQAGCRRVLEDIDRVQKDRQRDMESVQRDTVRQAPRKKLVILCHISKDRGDMKGTSQQATAGHSKPQMSLFSTVPRP